MDAYAGVQAVHGVLGPHRTLEAPPLGGLRHLRNHRRSLSAFQCCVAASRTADLATQLLSDGSFGRDRAAVDQHEPLPVQCRDVGERITIDDKEVRG